MDVLLRPYSEHDYDKLEEARNDFELQYTLLAHPKPNTRKKVQEWIENKTAAQNSVFFVISDNSKQTIGFVQATEIDFINRFCYVGIYICQEFRGKGIMKTAIRLLEKYLHNTFNIRKTLAKILIENLSSVQAFKKAGYSEAGILKKHFYFSSAFHDVSIYEKFINP